MMEERLPVSAEWFKRLTAIGAKECFKGKLNSILGQLSHPCWCLQLTDFADDAMKQNVHSIISVLRQYKHGTAPYSDVLKRYNMYTKAWSYSPCSCVYTYSGYNGGNAKIIPSSVQGCETLSSSDSRQQDRDEVLAAVGLYEFDKRLKETFGDLHPWANYYVANNYWHDNQCIGQHTDADNLWGAINADTVILTYTYEQPTIFMVRPAATNEHRKQDALLNRLRELGHVQGKKNLGPQIQSAGLHEAIFCPANSLLVMGGYFQAQLTHETLPHSLIMHEYFIKVQGQAQQQQLDPESTEQLEALRACTDYLEAVKQYAQATGGEFNKKGRTCVTIRHVLNHHALCPLSRLVPPNALAPPQGNVDQYGPPTFVRASPTTGSASCSQPLKLNNCNTWPIVMGLPAVPPVQTPDQRQRPPEKAPPQSPPFKGPPLKPPPPTKPKSNQQPQPHQQQDMQLQQHRDLPITPKNPPLATLPQVAGRAATNQQSQMPKQEQHNEGISPGVSELQAASSAGQHKTENQAPQYEPMPLHTTPHHKYARRCTNRANKQPRQNIYRHRHRNRNNTKASHNNQLTNSGRHHHHQAQLLNVHPTRRPNCHHQCQWSKWIRSKNQPMIKNGRTARSRPMLKMLAVTVTVNTPTQKPSLSL